jgi:hypothetical protein
MEGAYCLGVIGEAYGQTLAHSFIKTHLIGVNDFVGVRNKLTDDQLDAVAEQILAERWYLNQYEIILFCGRLRSGRYEDFYGSVDPMRILKSLDRFCSDRFLDCEKRERESEERSRKERTASEKTVTYGEWRAMHPELEGEAIDFLDRILLKK